MATRAYLKFSFPLAIASAVLILALTTLSALADGPTINMQLSTPAISTFFGPTPYAKTGMSIATGDINGDGYQDLLIGAPYADLVPFVPDPSWSSHCLTIKPSSLYCTSGGVYLYLGRPGISQTFDLASYAPNVTFLVPPDRWSREELGRSLATGDLNGDGLDDIIMGVSHYGTEAWPGAVVVWVGRTSITTTSAISVELYDESGTPPAEGGYNLKIVAAGPVDFGGWDVASDDINNDGLDDLIMTSPGAAVSPITQATYYPPDYQRYHLGSPPARTDNGAAYVWLGRSSLTASSSRSENLLVCLPEWTIYGQDSADWLGTGMTTGDLDGDGYDDLILGSPGYGNNSGKVHVFYGTDLDYATCGPTYENWEVRDLKTTSSDITLIGPASSASGTSYDMSVGNLNNDAYEDLIIASPFGNNGRGRVFVVYGRARAEFSTTITLLSQADVIVTGAPRTWLGASVLAGDLNHDSIDDLIIGAPDVNPDHGDVIGTENSTSTGKVYVMFGGSLNPTINLSSNNSAADLTFVGAAIDDWLGRGLAVTDLNNDGFNELVAGAPALDYQGRIDTGAVYVIDLMSPQLAVTPSLTQVHTGHSINFTATANTLLNGLSNVTSQTTFAISPAAGGSWSDHTYHSANPGVWMVTATYNTRSITTSVTVIGPPLAAFTCGSCTTPENQALAFNASASSGDAPLVYSWIFGDGASGNGVAINHTYADNGAYTATLTVQAATGLTSAITRPVTITNLAPVIQSVTNSGPIISGNSVTITVTASDVPADTLAYAFNCDNNASFEIGPQASPQANCHFSSDGVFTVTAKVTDEDGGSAQAATSVIVIGPPLAAFTCGNCTTPENQPLAFDAGDSSGDAPLSYSWTFGDGASGNGVTVNHTYADNGTYTAKLTLQAATGLTSTLTRTVTVTNLAPVIQSVTNAGPIIAGNSVTITVIASDVPADTLAYAFNCDNNASFEIGPQASPQANCHFGSDGVFTVTAKVTDGDGGSTQATTSVTVLSQPVAAFTCGDCTIAENQALTFDASGSSGAAPLLYAWTLGDGAIASGETVSHTYADNGAYTATLTIQAANDLTSTLTRPVTVTNLAPVIQEITNSGPIIQGDLMIISVTASDVPADTLVYSFNCDNNASFEIGPQASPQANCQFNSAGVFTAAAKVTDGDGGSAQATTSVTVLSQPVAAFTCGDCTIAENQPLAFNANSSFGDAPLLYSWTFGDGDTASGVTVNHTYANNGTYTARLTIQAANGLTSTLTRPVTVTNLAPVIQEVTNSGPIISGDSVTITITASDVPADTLAYAFNCDNNASFEIGPQASPQTNCSFNSDDIFTVTARVTDEDGGSSQATNSVTVIIPPVAAFSCESCTVGENQALTFDASGSSGATPLSYFWTFGDGVSGSGETISHSYADNGVYTATLTVQAANGLTSTITITRPVTITNLAPVIQVVTNSGPITSGNPVTITAIAADVPADTLAYAFDCDNDSFFEVGLQANPQTLCLFNADGTFTVTARVIDEDGGSVQATTPVSVSAPNHSSFYIFLPSISK